MKNVIVMLLCLVFTSSIVGCEKSIPNSDNSNSVNSSDYSEPDSNDFIRPSQYIVDTDSLTLESSMENADGDIIDIYTDSIYKYYVIRKTNYLRVLSLSDEMMATLGQNYLDNPDTLITNVEAEQRLREVVIQYFPGI